jgi:hypothetical protein
LARRWLLPRGAGRLNASHLIIAGLAGVATLVVAIAAVVGAPVDSPAAFDVILVLLGLGVHFSVGALVGGLAAESSGDPILRRAGDRLRDFAVGAIAAVGVLAALFWYVVVTYATTWVWPAALAGVAGAGGFFVAWRATRSETSRSSAALKRAKDLTVQFEPAAGLGGAVLGLALAAFLLLWSAAADTWAAQRAPAIIPLPSTGADAAYGNYVALGDSYSAGEGLDPVGQCHTSAQAYGRLLARQEHWKIDFEACSGAVIEDIFNPTKHGPQIKGPPDPSVGLVTLTIGGNDALFAKVVTSCVSHPSCMWGRFPPRSAPEVHPVLNGQPALLEHEWGPATILAIADKLGAPRTGLFARLHDQFPQARIVVLGYPHLFPDGQAPLAPDLMCAALLRRVDEPDRAEIRYMQDRFNDSLFEEAVRQGVDFINPNLLWASHEPCGAHGQWTNAIEAYLDFSLGPGPFHPNSAGQHALAALVSCYLQNNTTRPVAQQFAQPAGWLTPPTALALADGSPFPREWGTSATDFAGCGFPRVDASAGS